MVHVRGTPPQVTDVPLLHHRRYKLTVLYAYTVCTPLDITTQDQLTKYKIKEPRLLTNILLGFSVLSLAVVVATNSLIAVAVNCLLQTFAGVDGLLATAALIGIPRLKR